MGVRKLYSRAESVLVNDKCKDNAQINLISRETEKFLSEFIEFDGDGFCAECFSDDGATLVITVKIKNFKRVKVS